MRLAISVVTNYFKRTIVVPSTVTADGPPEDRPSLADEWSERTTSRSTRDRVYATALQLYEPTLVRDVADRADVSKETARDYLKWFAEVGLVERVGESPDRFVRNEDYFRWRRVQRLAGRSTEELERELKQLSETARKYRDRFDASSPDEVDALEHADYTEVETVWEALQEWRTVRRRIRELERARRKRDGRGAARA